MILVPVHLFRDLVLRVVGSTTHGGECYEIAGGGIVWRAIGCRPVHRIDILTIRNGRGIVLRCPGSAVRNVQTLAYQKTPLSYGGWIATREGEVARTTEMQADDPEESPASMHVAAYMQQGCMHGRAWVGRYRRI